MISIHILVIEIYFFKDRNKLSDEEKILEVIESSQRALSFEKIHTEMSSDRHMPRQRLKQTLGLLQENGAICKEVYTLTLSNNPRIESVIAEIYFKDLNQKRIYEEKILPKLMMEAKKSLL